MAVTNVDPIEMNYMEYILAQWKADMEDIQLCRDYYDGDQTIFLTDRMKEFLQLHHSEVTFRLNICKTIITALLDELVLKGFGTSEDGDVKPVAQWAEQVYNANNLDELQNKIHEATLRDRETFVIVDFDEEKRLPKIVHNDLYISTEVEGSGYGCWMVYSEEDPNKPAAAVKQWTETVMLKNKQQRTRQRRTVYYPDRIERFLYDGGWKPYNDDNRGEVIPLKDGSGKPLGLPVIHFRNVDEQSEIWDVLPNQDVINKMALDVLGISDLAGFPTTFVAGFNPVDSDGNPIVLSPGQIWGTTKDASTVKAERQEASDITSIVEALTTWISLTANLSATPVSRFIMTGQIASSETLKDQDKPLQRKAERRRVSFSNSWEQVMNIARRMSNVYGAAGLDENVVISCDWKLEYSQEQLNAMLTYGVPQEFIWRKAGLSQAEIDAIKETEEYKIALKSKVWAAVGAAKADAVPAETILRDFGYTDEDLARFASAQMAAINIQQQDSMPVDNTGNVITQ